MNKNSNNIICPFCSQGVLEDYECKKCRKHFLLCDECESVYSDKKNLKDEFDAGKCPHCSTEIS